jgi:hypothetical protein
MTSRFEEIKINTILSSIGKPKKHPLSFYFSSYFFQGHHPKDLSKYLKLILKLTFGVS